MFKNNDTAVRFATSSIMAAVIAGGLALAGAAQASKLSTIQVGNGAPLVKGGNKPATSVNLLSPKDGRGQIVRANTLDGSRTLAASSPAIRTRDNKSTHVGARTPADTVTAPR